MFFLYSWQPYVRIQESKNTGKKYKLPICGCLKNKKNFTYAIKKAGLDMKS